MTLTEGDPRAIAEELAAVLDDKDAALFRPRYNIAPTDLHWIVRQQADGRRHLVPATWGLQLTGGRAVINLRAETASRRRDFQERRCIAVADGFFEWTKGRERRPVWYHRPDAGLIFLACVFDTGTKGRPRFAVLTTEANDLVRPVHGRMPALIPSERLEEWLARPNPALLEPAPESALIATPVSRLANSPRNDSPEVLKPERTLFPL